MKRIRIEPPDGFHMSGALVETRSYEERMAEHRKEWRRQDQRRYEAPWRRSGLVDAEGDNHWLVFAWSAKQRCWVHIAERRVKSRRRKPMTMNRLFAGIRQQIGLKRDVVVKLITVTDHALALAADPKWNKRPPQHHLGRIVS